MSLQFPDDAAVAIARELLVNVFDLTAKLFILAFPMPLMRLVGFVVIAAGSQLAYLAGFRNRAKFLAVITDVSAFLCC